MTLDEDLRSQDRKTKSEGGKKHPLKTELRKKIEMNDKKHKNWKDFAIPLASLSLSLSDSILVLCL
jgi:hypothetical protein